MIRLRVMWEESTVLNRSSSVVVAYDAFRSEVRRQRSSRNDGRLRSHWPTRVSVPEGYTIVWKNRYQHMDALRVLNRELNRVAE